jgi:hypothetical protein
MARPKNVRATMPPQEQDPTENSAQLSTFGENTQERHEDATLQSILNTGPDYGMNLFANDEVNSLNDPDVTHLPDPPVIGGQPLDADMWGSPAETPGQVSSPPLYALGASFPTVTQFRVWRSENGNPVLLGAISASCSEDDFIEEFYEAMPQPGERRAQYRLRPIDARGVEIKKEITLTISEHHQTLQRIRRRIKAQKEDVRPMSYANGSPIIVNPPASPAAPDTSGQLAEEMGRLFENTLETAERRAQMYERSLEEEREKMRREAEQRAEERVRFASTSAETVQKMMERLMVADRSRGEEQIGAQREQSQMLLSTLTTVFQQQQQAAREQSERLREADQMRMAQDREFFARQQQEQEQARQRQMQEAEQTRQRERAEWERRQEIERARAEQELKRAEMQRAAELEQLRLAAKQQQDEANARREMERAEIALKIEQAKLDAERQRQQMVEERERWRTELEARRQQDREEWERKQALQREEMERARRDADLRDQLRREEAQREADRRREDLQREELRRREEMQMQIKQMEMQAQRDREHQEKMMEMARLERESQREAVAARERAEAEARQLAEAERQRQHALTMREMEISKERDREHAERMVQMTKQQQQGGLAPLGEMLGMDTPELLQRIFGGGGGDDKSGWADAAPKILGAMAEVGKNMLGGKGPAAPAEARRSKPQKPASPQEMMAQAAHAPAPTQQMVQIQTADGPRIIPLEMAQSMGFVPAESAATAPATRAPAPINTQVPLPDRGFVPPEPRPVARRDPQFQRMLREDQEAPLHLREAPPAPAAPTAPALPAPAPEVSDYDLGTRVDTAARAREAHISLIDAKKSRKALREMADALRAAPETEWETKVTEAVLAFPGVISYIQAVTLYAALAEAGADRDLATRVVAALRQHALVGDQLVYTETDLAAAKAATKELA